MKLAAYPQDIDGIDLFNWFRFGAREVEAYRKYLNQINVFPVADGDTGNNLFATLKAMNEWSINHKAFNASIRSISDLVLANARGNSGNIFASYINGIAVNGQAYETVNLEEFSTIARKAVEHLNHAVENPVEGTMISVIRDWANFLHQHHNKYHSFQEMLSDAYQHALSSLKQTTNQLMVLKKNRVVDSGAAGFVRFLYGINLFFDKRSADQETISLPEESPTMEQESETPRYCIEILLKQGAQASSGEPVELTGQTQQIRSLLNNIGNSIVVLSNEDMIKVHVHTDSPSHVMEALKPFGNAVEVKVDDMKLETSIHTHRKHRIGLITDSIADLPEDYKLEKQIHTIPLGILMDDTIYLDKATIDLPGLFRMIPKADAYPTSSQPESGRIREILEKAIDLYDSLIIISVSGKLSGTYNSIRQELQRIDLHGKQVTLIDSRTNSGAQGLLVKKTVEALEEGLSHEEVVARIDEMLPKLNIYVCLNTIENAVRGGRVPKTIGKFGMKIGLRPIMSLDAEGKGTTFGAALSQKGITGKIMGLVKKIQAESGIEAYSIVHAENLALAQAYEEQLTAITGKPAEFITEISSVVAIHSGPGSVAVCLLRKGE